MITFENKKLYELLLERDRLVNSGRKISKDIEGLEIKIKRFNEKEKRITAKVIPPKELTDRGDTIARQLEELSKELEKIAKAVTQAKLDAIPEEMKKDHQELLKQVGVLERDRNKIALKIQKIKDKIMPVVQKHVKPLLGEYEDIETAKLGTTVNTIDIIPFSYLDEFKAKFRR